MSANASDSSNRFAAARVIALQAQALSDLAERHGLDALSYLLAMAAIAARDEQRPAR